MVKKALRPAVNLSLTFLLLIIISKSVPELAAPVQNSPLLTVTGTVVDVAVEHLKIRTESGQELTFQVTGASRNGLPGAFTGDTFTLHYSRKYYGRRLTLTAHSYEKIAGVEPNPETTLSDRLPVAWQDGGIFEDAYDRAYELLKTLSTEQKVGQLFLARFPNADLSVGTVNRYQPGGFILFANDYKGRSSQTIRDMISAVQNASVIPLLVATDEEGGDVVRVSQYSHLADAPFPSPQTLLAKGGMAAVEQDAEKKARLLKTLGINLNLAPVADVSTNPADYIYRRTAGQPPKETGDYVVAAVKGTQTTGISAALKHFPGYGNNPDTHTGPARDSRTLESFASSDFLPFRAGIAAGVHGVLVSHSIVSCMDSENPASLSPAVHEILRDDLGFTGVIMTDDLYMDAISGRQSGRHPAVEAVLADNDLIIITDLSGGYDAVFKAVEQGIISAEQLDRAVFRLLAWKCSKGLL